MMAVFLIHPEGFQDFAGAHRQLPHAHTSGAIDGVRDRGHRRDDRYFTNTAQAERVPGFVTSTSTVSIIGRSRLVGMR